MRLMLTLTAVVGLALMTRIPSGQSAPINGVFAKKVDVPADGLVETKRFRGGERATVQVVGDHKSETTVHITVHDENNKLVAEDKGREPPVGDLAAVIWYPPRDANYRITIRNLEGRAGRYWIAIR